MRQTVARHRVAPPSPEVSRHARLLLLDTLGCALAGRRAVEVSKLEQSLAALEAGDVRLPGGPGLGARSAAQVLAIASTWDEACEGHAYAHGRPGIPVIAALLPLALGRGGTLGALIAALVAGYEIGARAGGWLRVPQGIHVDGNWPALGAAAGVATLLGSDALQAVNAAACQLPFSLYLPVRSGLTIRNAYLGHAATLGLDAALAAQAGFGAPPDALAEYAEHFCPAETQPPPAAQADLILDGYFKPFAAVRHVHYGAVAARALRKEISLDSIGEIHLSIYEEAITYCGNRDPGTPLAAQFSLSFAIAAMLRFGELEPSVYDEPRFSDPELRRLEKLVRIEPDRELTARRQRGARLTLDARSRIVRDDDPGLGLDEDGVVAKFVRNSGTRRFADAWLATGHRTPVRELWGML